MLMWRGEVLRPPAQQSIKHMQAWKLKTKVSVDTLEEEADALAASRFSIGHIAIGVALGYIDFRFPELAWRDGHPRLAAWYETFDGAAVRQGERAGGRAMIHHHSIGDARITGVIEYSGPTHRRISSIRRSTRPSATRCSRRTQAGSRRTTTRRTSTG